MALNSRVDREKIGLCYEDVYSAGIAVHAVADRSFHVEYISSIFFVRRLTLFADLPHVLFFQPIIFSAQFWQWAKEETEAESGQETFRITLMSNIYSMLCL